MGPHVHAFAIAVMGRNSNPEFGFRSRCGALRLAGSHGAERLDNARRHPPGPGTGTWRGPDGIPPAGAGPADGREPETGPIQHSSIGGPECYR